MSETNSTESERSIQRAKTTAGLILEAGLTGIPRNGQAMALSAHIRSAVRSGSLPAGTRLPASRTLADDLGVSRGVVVRAYEQLVAEGYLQARQGHGTVVSAAPRPPRTPVKAPRRLPTNPGLPAGAMFPRKAWLRSAQRALTTLPDADLGYGDPAGLLALRTELSAYLGRARGLVAPPDRIVVVNGFGQGSRLLADVLRERGIGRVGIEDPGSVGLRDQLARCGTACEPVAVDAEGLRVDVLAESDLRAVVVTPAHQFPTGVVMSARRRHALLDWARTTGGLVVEDDYDAEYRYDRSPVGALQGLGPDVVAYGGSVSKTLAPALRLGWLVLPEALVGPVAAAKYDADLGTGAWEQATLADFLARGELDRHIRRSAAAYRRRRDRLSGEIERRLPGWRVTGTAAGLHLVVHPPGTTDDTALARRAVACGLDARPLSRYSTRPLAHPGLVIGYGHQRPDTLAAGVAGLAAGVPGPGRSPTAAG